MDIFLHFNGEKLKRELKIEKRDLSNMETLMTRISTSIFCKKTLVTEVAAYYVRHGNYVMWPQI